MRRIWRRRRGRKHHKKFTQSENNGKCKITMKTDVQHTYYRYVNLLNVGNGKRLHRKRTRRTRAREKYASILSKESEREREEEKERKSEEKDSFLRFYLFNGTDC